MIRRRAALPLFLLSACSGAAVATSYVPMTDEHLADQAPLIAVVEVRGDGTAAADGRAETEYRMDVERLLKGSVHASEITVRVPGVERPDGLSLRIWGAPRFAPGERALLFLAPRSDGTFAISQLMLGAFHEAGRSGQRLAVRDLSGAHPVRLPGRTAAPREPVRDFDRFVAWIEQRARGIHTAADYASGDSPERGLLTAPFTLFSGGSGHLRWFDFDAGGSVSFSAHQDGQPGVTGGGFTEFQNALAAWNADPETTISYTYAGTTTATGGLDDYDGINAIVFERNLGSPFSCASGGVLAIGGPWFNGSTSRHNGRTYVAILGADVETNQGISCFFTASPNASKAAEELFGHELGHTLGLAHSQQTAALMYAFIHDDGRGAQLSADDRDGIAELYKSAYDFFTIAPCRVYDSRLSGGAFTGTEQRTVSVLNQCGIPLTAQTLAINLTAVEPSGPGRLTIFPALESLPNTSNLNYAAGTTRANSAILVLSGYDTRSFTVQAVLPSGGGVDVVVDVTGYFQ